MKPRRAKILATMGPALEDSAVLERVIKAGANCFRINFSHGDREQHVRYLQLIRNAARKLKHPIGILADLMGPKVRVDAREYNLENGAEVGLVARPGDPELSEIGISYPGLLDLVGPGQRILLDDGKLEIRAERIAKRTKGAGKKLICLVIRGGKLKPNKSLNVPGVDLKLPVLSKKDKEDLRFIATAGFDWIAASFIRNGADVLAIKRFMEPLGIRIPVIAKVESAQAVDNLRNIVEAAEGVMVARGDLGVELDLEMIPSVQRSVVMLARELGKVTIIATQMLESMCESPRPSRAEVTDVSTAALARVDALMLSGETATGKYPVETVEMMDRIIRTTERNLDEEIVGISHPETIALVCEAGLYLAANSGAKALVAISTHGTTPRILSTYRGNIPVVVACILPEIYQRSTLYYSVQPTMTVDVSNPELIFRRMEGELKAAGMVKPGDVIVFTFGHPIHTRLGTNSIRRWVVDVPSTAKRATGVKGKGVVKAPGGKAKAASRPKAASKAPVKAPKPK
ncbi:MAG: pyruvate kinase [Fibrobacteres bacterium]|nr:pyruvate kinase [Fibrobacterota bacterium]